YLGLLAQVWRLKSEARQQPLQFPPELLAEGRQIAERERSLYFARQSELQAQLAVFEQQVVQRKQELAELRSKQTFLAKAVALIHEELEITKPLLDKGQSGCARSATRPHTFTYCFSLLRGISPCT
ncbi:MAG TPA: hypothetical protein VIW27_09435, partial [Gammaproteobacteria bacterium]